MKYGRLLRTLSVVLTLCLGLLAAGPTSSSPDISARVARTDRIGGSGLGVRGNTAGNEAVPDQLLSSPEPAASTTDVAGSEWYTYANGDDILVLEMEGGILWAGTRAGGLVRWDTRDDTFVQFLKPQDPLPGNTVRDIYIDADGNKWLATDDGLSVLDDNGTPDKADDVWYTFTYWSIGSYLPSNRITAVAMDEAGFLWIGTSQYWDPEAEAYTGGGLVEIDTQGTLTPADDEWLQTYMVTNTMSSRQGDIILGLASDNITDVLPVPGNRVWVATQRHWAYREFTTADGTVGQWLPIYGGLSRLDHNGTPDTADDTWKTWTCEDGPQRDAGVSCIINRLELDANGYVWAAQRGRGAIAVPCCGDGGLDAVQFDKSDGLLTNDIQSITFGPPDAPEWQNTVWISTYDAASGYGRGITVLDHKGTVQDKADDTWNDRTPVPGEEITTDSSLPGDRVQAMVAGGGKIWMGAGGRYGMGYGIGVFDLSRLAFQEPLTTASAGLPPYNYITDLAVGQTGTRWENQVWVATGNKRERRYGVGALLLDTQGTPDPADDTWTQFTKENTDDDGLPPWTGLASNNVTAIAIDGDYVWFGTQPATWEVGGGVRGGEWTDGGLSVYDGEQWTIRTDANTGGQYAGLLDDRISALAIGCTGKLWIALGSLRDNSGLGLNIVDTKGDPHNLSNDEWSTPIQYSTIPSNLVTGIATDCAHNQLWISTSPFFAGFGTQGGGVARYDYGTGRWTSWSARDGIESYEGGRNKAFVLSVNVGPDGTVWAGTWGTRTMGRQELINNWPYVPAAINWFHDDSGSHQAFPNDGWVSSMAIDANRTVWVGTSRGGMDIDPPDGKEDDSLAGRAVGGIQHTVDGTRWGAWTTENSPLVTNDIEVIKVGPDGSVWAGTNGWGIMRFLGPLPVIRFTAELASPANAPGVGETSEVQVTLHNGSPDASLNAPRFRLHIEQDPNAPVFEPADPPLVSQPIVVEPGSSATAAFTLRAVRAGSVTLDVDVIGEVGTESDTSQYTTSIRAHPVTIRVGRKFYLPLIVAQAELHHR